MRLRMPRRETAASINPVAALDRDLALLAEDLHVARLRGEDTTASYLTDVIDLCLDQRGRATAEAPGSYCP